MTKKRMKRNALIRASGVTRCVKVLYRHGRTVLNDSARGPDMVTLGMREPCGERAILGNNE
jgi:hypothetical protein